MASNRTVWPSGEEIVDWRPALGGEAERIVGAVFAEYDIPFHPADYDSDLRRIEEVYLKRGMFRFLLVDGSPVATVAVKALTNEECEFKRLYLLKSHRGAGRGGRMMDEAIHWAREGGFKTLIAWSDTRFNAAHALYRSRGFEQIGVRPEPGPDPAEEHGFRLRLS